MPKKLTHILLVLSAFSGGRKGLRRAAMTYAELLFALLISGLVAAATFTLISAYTTQAVSDDLQDISVEASLLYAYVQGWVQDAEFIIAASGPTYDPAPNNPPRIEDQETGIAVLAAFMGARMHAGVFDASLQYDEVEALVFAIETDYTADGATGAGVLERLYFAEDNALKDRAFWPDPPDGVGDPGALCVPDDWLANADRQFVSNKVLRMSWQPASGASCDPVYEEPFYPDISFTLLDFARVGPDIPLRYSFQVLANTRGARLD